MGHFSAIAELLAGRFTPLEAGSAGRAKSDKRLTLHDALKIKLGTVPDWSVLAYSNASELNQAIDLTYEILSRTVDGRADVWATRSDRTEEQVIAALITAELDPRSAEPRFDILGKERPSIAKIPGVGKPRAAIASTAAGIAEATGHAFGSVVQRALAAAVDETDSALIAALDAESATLPDELHDPTLAIAFAKAVGNWFETSDSWKVSTFCRMLSVDLGTIEDNHLVAHLANTALARKN